MVPSDVNRPVTPDPKSFQPQGSPTTETSKKEPSQKIKTIVIFPYSGYENNKRCEWYFWWTVDLCRTVDPKPIVVISRDTIIKNQAPRFLADKRTKTLDVIQTWSVNTCQNWLIGWGHVLDTHPDAQRVAVVPGDIVYAHEDQTFYENLKSFLETSDADIAIGDFRIGDKSNAKGLVDVYGTYPLLANWFPQVSKNIHLLPLIRPRSEFLNIKTNVLRELLIFHRKFATEQTVNILIKSCDNAEGIWKYKLSTVLLGTLSDIKTFRDYSGCVDQIERIEVMLSTLWREINEPKKTEELTPRQFEAKYIEFSDQYDRLYDKSKGIMETARITLRALLGV